PRILHLKMIERYALATLTIRLFDRILPRGATSQVPRQPPSRHLLTAIDTHPARLSSPCHLRFYPLLVVET
ncbi:MAG: hypothetical protein ACRDIB_08960, partial [Ardenticatenaceae bacterium]